MSDSFGAAVLIVAQVVLLALHYGGSTFMGIEWATLPWWVVWLPFLIIGVWFVIAAAIFVGALVLVALSRW